MGSSRLIWALALAPLIGFALLAWYHPVPGDGAGRAVHLAGTWKIHEGHDSEFARADLDDASWRDIELPGGYHAQGFSARTAWVRKRFQAPTLTPGENGFITLGNTRGGFVRVFLNGTFVGEQGVVGVGLKPELSSRHGWEFDARLLRGDGTDVIALQLSFARLGYDGIGDARMYLGSAEVLKVHLVKHRALERAIDYGALAMCLLAMVLMGALWLTSRDSRARCATALIMLFGCVYYLAGATGLFIGFWFDPVAAYSLVVISVPILGFALGEFGDQYFHGRVTWARKGNRVVCALGLLLATVLPIDTTHLVARILGVYLLIVIAALLVLAVRSLQSRADRHAPFLVSGLAFMTLAGASDMLADAHIIDAPRVFPLALASGAILACAALVGDFLARIRATAAQGDTLRVKNAELTRALGDAEAGNQMKGRFLATVSHDWRAPLRDLVDVPLALMDSFVEDELSDHGWSFHGNAKKAREALARLSVSAIELSDALSNITDMAELDDEEPEFTRVPVPAVAVISKAIDRVAPLARARKITVLLDDVPGDLYPLVDVERCTQVLVHLLKNAIKFSNRSGQVEVGARRDGDKCVFTVADQGVGIAAEHHETIFERFWQLESDDARDDGSLGLGLALARQLTELQGGRISVESEPGKGSVFSVRLRASKSASSE